MNATDYTWFTKSCYLYNAYCLTLVRGIERTEALKRIDTETMLRANGLLEFLKASDANSFFDGRNGNRFFIGATELDGWTLLVESNGFLGVTGGVIGPLSAGTQVVSHFRNVDAEDRFCWMVDGELRLQFEPLFPFRRTGSEANGLVDVMAEVGYDLRDIEDRDFELHTEATFALAEHLTGVRLTAELIDSADYLCGLAELKR